MERITELIQHPEQMDRDTLYELRSLCALYPYYQTARLLMLQNLYLLHDPTFDEELRRAAIYITDRRVLFNMIEASHYQLKPQTSRQQNASAATAQTELSMTVNVRFTNNVNHNEDFEQQFTAVQSYDSMLSLNSVQEELVNKMVTDICDQIFNACVANW